MVDDETHPVSGHEVHLALTLSHDYTPFQNSAGLKLDVAMPFDPEHDANQQFIFRSDFNVIIDSAVRGGMVWDVCDGDNLNPPDGTVFYVFPFHGRHNQQFIFRNGHIYAKQNGQVVTYVGGDAALVMMQQSPALRSRQTFEIRLL